MHETGGPVSQMDASLQSLIPLWDWYLERFYVGFPEVAEGALPSKARTLGWTPSSPLEARAGFALEPFSHYLFEILKAYDGSAEWVISPIEDPRVLEFQTTVVATPLQTSIAAEDIAQNLANNLLAGRKNVMVSEGLLNRVLRTTALGDRKQHPHLSGSILSPLLEEPRISWSSDIRIPPAADAPIRFASASKLAGGGDFLVASPRSSMEFDGPPINNVAALARGLSDLGVRHNGDPVTETVLSTPRTQLFVGDRQILMQPHFAASDLTSLSVQPIAISASDWARFCDRLDALVSGLGLKFGPPEHFGSADGSPSR